jgi:predicted GNAT family acetyltransferase
VLQSDRAHKRARRTIRLVDVRVADNPDEGRFEIVADGQLAGAAFYRMEGEAVAFTHTEVDHLYKGQGIGSKLAAGALDAMRERGLRVLPYCPFMRAYIERHPEYVDLVPEDARTRFRLR